VHPAWVIPYTIFVILLLAAQALALGLMLFDQRARLRGHSLLEGGRRFKDGPVDEADLAGLPAPVARWLRYCGVPGAPVPRGVRLRQRGRFRLGADKPWMPLRALQYYTLDPPQFLWFTRMRIGGLPLIGGGDFFSGGRGQLSIRLLEFIRLADASGPKLDEAELLRWLSEIIWLPAAALSPAIEWEALDDSRARASIRHAGSEASAVFHFNAEGCVSSISASRYMGFSGDARRENWVAPVLGWGEFEPGAGYGRMRLPSIAAALWRLPDGDLAYIELEVTQISYDPADI
jgi:hypothetical protein